MTYRSRKVLGVPGGNYTRVLLLLIESGALVAAAKLTEFVLFELAPDDGISGLNAIDVVYECMPQITVSACPVRPIPNPHFDVRSACARAQGLAPTCIIYAVNKGFTQPDSYYSSSPKDSLVFGSPENTNPSGRTGTTLFTSAFGSSGLDSSKEGTRRGGNDSETTIEKLGGGGLSTSVV